MFRFPLVAGFGLLVVAPASSQEATFPAPPRLAISAAEFAERRKSADFAKQRDQAVRAAEGLLARPISIPTGWGNWVFYYACPDDGSPLNAVSEQEHRCPRCKKIYGDERTVAAPLAQDQIS